jgi:hypothetical protein
MFQVFISARGTAILTNVLAEWLQIMLHVLETQGTNRGPDKRYADNKTEIFYGFPQSSQEMK